MFGCVAAWGVAACLVIWPVACGVESSTFAKANAARDAATIPSPFDTGAAQASAAEIAFQIPDSVDDDSHTPPSSVASFDPIPPKISAPVVPEPFDLATAPVTSGNVVTKWAGVEAAIRRDRDVLARCRENSEHCPDAARNFLAIIDEGRALSGRGRIGVINRAINLTIQPMSDMAQWGVPDRWSPPLETFATGRGDCEDYAIAKYVALTEAGIAAADVKLVIVRNTAVRQDHAVTAVRLDDDWIMLDNRWLTLISDIDMPQAVPLFVLDQSGARRFEPAAMASVRRAARPASLDF
jgi:predicted transglutaminase-like cysteine proteinase